MTLFITLCCVTVSHLCSDHHQIKHMAFMIRLGLLHKLIYKLMSLNLTSCLKKYCRDTTQLFKNRYSQQQQYTNRSYRSMDEWVLLSTINTGCKASFTADLLTQKISIGDKKIVNPYEQKLTEHFNVWGNWINKHN